MDVRQIVENAARVRERIAEAGQRAGRSDPVELVAVTKGHPPELMRAAVEAGLGQLGENRVAELEAKRPTLDADVEWHLIGHLQRNKARRALPLFDLIHSVDTVRLAEVLSAEGDRAQVNVPILLQVNASGEETKGGFGAAELMDAAGRIVSLPRLRVLGLMTMAPLTEDEGVLRKMFAQTRQLFEMCGARVPGFEARHLSMGMSNDYEIAVEEGSTMVRLGTVLFGERP
jgi:hypothetical protein